MQSRNVFEWSRLDNAAKIFPSTSSKEDTKVFRFACELYETVDPQILQTALDQTIVDFPMYRSVLKKGMFWYYFESSALKPTVREEDEPPCSSIYDGNVKTLLFEVSYFGMRINLEVYHALSDGTGALQFLRVLVCRYLMIKHREEFTDGLPVMDYDASMTEKMDDSFQKYYQQSPKPKKEKMPRAYQLKGEKTAESGLRIIEGIAPVKQVIAKSHELNATMTAFLAAVMMCAIYEEMPLRYRKNPVVLTVPVNLRNYFSSESARNFFSVINVGYNFNNNSGDFADVVSHVSESFRRELTAQELGKRMNQLAALEHNIFMRIVPLALKDFVLRLANRITDIGVTAALSNVGRTDMPPAVRKFIRLFDVFTSTKRLQLCICSYQDNLVMSFSTSFLSTDIPKNFFRSLAKMGIDIEIVSNQIAEDKEGRG